jgi:hypothetical protein
MSADVTDILATMDRASRLLTIQREARAAGAEISLAQASSVLRWFEDWEARGRPLGVVSRIGQGGGS